MLLTNCIVDIFHQYSISNQSHNPQRTYLIHHEILLKDMFFFKPRYIKKLPVTEGRTAHVSQEHAQANHTRKQGNGKTEGENHKGKGKPRERSNVSAQGKTTDSNH